MIVARHVLAMVLVAGVTLVAPAALAHAVGARIEAETAAVVIAFAYGDGAAIAFGEVTVTAPDGRVHQKGRADRQGRFAVAVPAGATDGEWIAEIDDGQGHQSRLAFTPDSPAEAVALRDLAVSVLGAVSVALLMLSLALLAMRDTRLHRPAKEP